MIGRAVSSVVVLLLIGCEPDGSPRARTPEPYESDVEYRQTLSHTLEGAPTEYASQHLTSVFNAAYLMGGVEASEELRNGEWSQLGCLYMSQLLVAVRPNDVPPQDVCDGLVDPSKRDAQFGGARFADGRLRTVKLVPPGNPRIVNDYVLAFENGYAAGYVHDSRSPEAVETLKKAVARGCATAFLYAHQRTPIYDDVGKPVSDACRAKGQALAAEHEDKVTTAWRRIAN